MFHDYKYIDRITGLTRNLKFLDGITGLTRKLKIYSDKVTG